MYALQAVGQLGRHRLTFDTQEGADYFMMLWRDHWVPGITFVQEGWVNVQTKLGRKRRSSPRPVPIHTLEETISLLFAERNHEEAQVA